MFIHILNTQNPLLLLFINISNFKDSMGICLCYPARFYLPLFLHCRRLIFDEYKHFRYLPKLYQAILASATLSEDVKSLKGLVLHNPVTLKLEEPELAPSSQLTHYTLFAEEMDKASILYALLKLHLIKGKTIIFVNTVDRCYK